MPLNIPILLTWLRIILIPLLIAIYYVPESWVQFVGRDPAATVVFVVAAVTDWLDGYLARRWQQTSAFGAFLDPVADKLMVAAALIVLVQLGRLDAILAAIIIGREITISALREWMAQIGAHRSIAVSMIGKIKTTAQMMAIPFLLYHAPLKGLDVFQAGTWLIYVAAVLTLWSMGYYMRMAWPHLIEEDRKR
ncbi:MAG: CDP-diacylglycerol--glycerol-3-phosphate 3-phosphatidyltransferase [Candidatus Accumulibacter regalis]|jgi:cardiolipin synthase|uniref:CDP-diacylglycerol--glycerol-3-phosphate 3-phosphatidyltransferase n=1 Tax=Accumulibacter regalis TaxID=522306 RepID=A0A011NU80_ACCRE|nr:MULTISPECIES: CDP-diacylglycerol--glycerol-3-phosphate 3-phosphatidyltransferase [unclassified Candidatus Accumulibacter]EXI86303.1 MAG: CDP-diacylglycerol--glycerol-3-phosphate 3-phosphatidyltransferase [Candidatus Accumulibacter regalis]MQM33012.1 CDP-diacylglycerol--glycerol-3-phosphate 3-phosphatidyltransferase [Candidatus Accumulibacter phosphatis]MBL8368603.1 CDP-diacylglycerol--glycerol-3-phosphate 3-phosphatidyltransferase [Accumulibacter sp.]MBN8515367.1 CDP-diacylglycerol--glycerol